MVKSEIITITPSMAQQLLERNTKNRKIRPTAIDRYAKDMADGNWIVNGEAIVVGEDGTLEDGQNRLLACVKAGVPFDTVYVTGTNSQARETIDLGIVRTLADALTWKEVPYPQATAATLAWIVRYDQMLALNTRQLTPGGRLSRQEVLHHLDQNPGLVNSAAFAEEHRRRIPASPGIVGATHFLISRHYSAEEADKFYTEVAQVGLADEDSPAFLLREWLLDHQTLMQRKPPTVIFAMNVKAARFWLQNLAVKRLAWKRTSQRKGEEFPRIDLKLV